ncbi:hypothetical protein BaRGS_00031490, partial [Batillaria attramentaria]
GCSIIDDVTWRCTVHVSWQVSHPCHHLEIITDVFSAPLVSWLSVLFRSLSAHILAASPVPCPHPGCQSCSGHLVPHPGCQSCSGHLVPTSWLPVLFRSLSAHIPGCQSCSGHLVPTSWLPVLFRSLSAHILACPHPGCQSCSGHLVPTSWLSVLFRSLSAHIHLVPHPLSAHILAVSPFRSLSAHILVETLLYVGPLAPWCYVAHTHIRHVLLHKRLSLDLISKPPAPGILIAASPAVAASGHYYSVCMKPVTVWERLKVKSKT